MNRSAVFAAALSCALLSGCAAISGHPQTAEEFRIAVPGAFLAEVESFEVNRPFSEVAHTFQKKAPECLNVTIKTVSRTNMSYQVIVTTYKPTVLVNGAKAELHVQFHHDQGVMNVTKEPDGGYYLVVADLFPMGNNRTRVDIYGPSMGHDVLMKGIKGWAASDSSGCPDLTA